VRPLPKRLADAADAGIDLAVSAPGRANLIGEHTDYNNGFVLPVALDIATYIAGAEIDGIVSLTSLEEPGRAVVDLATGRGTDKGWGRYVTAVVRALLDESVDLRGFSGVVGSDVPSGAGLSSSAALEVAVATALVRSPLDAIQMARICRRAENHYVGVRSGIMDQLASAAGRAGSALLIDCRDDTFRFVAVPDAVRIVVIDSRVRRDLSTSAYNERRMQCEDAARVLGVASLREAGLDLLTERRRDLGDVTFRRARHVITENARVLSAADALEAGDFVRVGRLFGESHESLRSDYEVSHPQLDELVRIACGTSGVYGARLTGAGFGGCTVQVVDAGRAEAAATEIAEGYRRMTGEHARWWVSVGAEGAGECSVDGSKRRS
jgi:galactokinase